MRINKLGYVMSLEEDQQAFGNQHMHKTLPSLKTTLISDIDHLGIPYYRFVANTLDTCAICSRLDGMAFHLSVANEGINMPPIHPNCKCNIEPYDFEDDLPVNFVNWNPGGPTPNDWRGLGWNGQVGDLVSGEIYSDSYFGKAIARDNLNQADIDMHIVDRIARILFHETSDPHGQAALIWLMLNRMLKEGSQYTTNQKDELDLYNIVVAAEQFEVFQAQHNQRTDQPSSYAPLEWIAEIENPQIKQQQEQSRENSLRLAKYLVSASCNPQIDNPNTIRRVLASWVPNPFDCDTPYDVWEYRAQGSVSSGKIWQQTIGGNTFFIW